KKNINVFDDRGEWKMSKEIYGKGPGELLLPNDMTIDKNKAELVLIDETGILLKLDLQNHLALTNQFDTKRSTQSICVSGQHIVINHSIPPGGVNRNSSDDNTIIYDKESLEVLSSISSNYSSSHWLVDRQLSKGKVFCSDTHDIHISEWFLPRLRIYDKSDFTEKIMYIFNDLSLIKVKFYLRDGKPTQTFEFEGERQYIENILSDKNYIYLQLKRFLNDGAEEGRVFRIDKKNLEVDYLGALGTIHWVYDSKLITSVKDPYPQILIYQM
ncbi:MAG: 6-bladed beta-propeller, partial [Balneolaceae bacterium]